MVSQHLQPSMPVGAYQECWWSGAWCHSICSQASQLVHIKSADGLVPIWSHTICNQASQLVLIKSADGLVPIWSHSICNQASQLVHINSADWRQCCKHISAYEKGISLGPSTNLSSLNKPYWRGINERSAVECVSFLSAELFSLSLLHYRLNISWPYTTQ